jgi:hypothetical protein
MSSTPPLSKDEFYRAARRAPPHPLRLEKGNKIIVGQDEEGGEGSSSAGSLSRKSGVVVSAVRKHQTCSIRFDGDGFDTELSVQRLQSLGYCCPGVEHRGDEFCEDAFKFTCEKNQAAHKRSVYDYYRDLYGIGVDLANVSDEKIMEKGDKSPIAGLRNGPPPASSPRGWSGDLFLFPHSCLFRLSRNPHS